jgi:hypothetical protein
VSPRFPRFRSARRLRRATTDPVPVVSPGERLAASLRVATAGVAHESAEDFKAGRYADVVRLLDGVARSPDELNNLGCAYAVLAAEGDVGLWLRAESALRESAESTSDTDRRERATKNLERVAAASGGAVVADG